MLIGELAITSGLTKASIRHYVDIGLLKPTPKQAGQRRYQDFSNRDVERLKWISLGKTMGFSLKEIGPYLNAFMSGETPKSGWGPIFGEKLVEIEQRIEELQKVRALLLSKISGDIA